MRNSWALADIPVDQLFLTDCSLKALQYFNTWLEELVKGR